MLWEAVKKEPISYWLMLWSSSRIREARKEIGLTQPRQSKKLGGLRYIGQIRLGGSIAVHVSQLHFLVNYLPLGGQRRGFTPLCCTWRVYCCSCVNNTSLCCPCICISLPLSLPFIFFCGCDFNWLGLFINYVYSLCSFSTYFVFVIKLELVILFWRSKRSQCILHYLNFHILKGYLFMDLYNFGGVIYQRVQRF